MSSLKPEVRRIAVSALVAASALAFLIQCREPSPALAPVQTEAPDVTPSAPAPPAVPGPLTRSDLVSAAARAAAAYAEGLAPAGADPFVGRNFAIRVPFGCAGPSPETGGVDGVANWSWGPENRTIQITLTPGDWTGSALIAQPGGGAPPPAWEAVEGIWIPRPWIAAETCPKVVADPLAGAPAASPETLGIAAVFEQGGSRIGRRNGKAYSFTLRAGGDQPLSPPSAGFRLFMEGRVVGFPDGRALRCRASGPDQRPVCIAAVQLDKVTFETATGETLSEWRGG